MTLFHLLFNSKHLDAWISGFTGIFGAILGSLVTILYTAYYNKKTKNIERKEKFATSAFSLYHKLNLIYSTSKSFKDTFHESINRVKPNEKLCFSVMAIHFSGENIDISIDELWMANQIVGSELLQSLNCLDTDFNSCIDYMNLYANERENVFNKILEVSNGNLNTVKGTIFSCELTEQQKENMGFLFNNLDQQILEIVSLIERTEQKAWMAMKLLIESPKKPLGENMQVTILDLNGKEVTLKPK